MENDKHIIEELKLEFEDLPGHVISKISYYQFKFVYDCIETGCKKPIIITNFGIFKLKRRILNNPDLLNLIENRRLNNYRDNNKSYHKRFNNYDKKDNKQS
jgi:hypothetical protein